MGAKQDLFEWSGIPPRVRDKVARAFLPFILLHMVHEGSITEEVVDDPSRLGQLLRKRLRRNLKGVKWTGSATARFVTFAEDAWKRRDKEIAIVLLACAIEQQLNYTLRLIIEPKGHKSEFVTELIRIHNIDAKTSWLFEMYSGEAMPKYFRSKIKRIADVRNQIVHDKAVWDVLDGDGASPVKLRAAVKSLGRLGVTRFFSGFENYCQHVIIRCNPAFVLMAKAHRTLQMAGW